MLLGALKLEMGPLSSKVPPKSVFFLVRDFGPLSKNSGPNPMSFQFLVGFALGPHESFPPLGKSWLRH